MVCLRPKKETKQDPRLDGKVLIELNAMNEVTHQKHRYNYVNRAEGRERMGIAHTHWLTTAVTWLIGS